MKSELIQSNRRSSLEHIALLIGVCHRLQDLADQSGYPIINQNTFVASMLTALGLNEPSQTRDLHVDEKTEQEDQVVVTDQQLDLNDSENEES